MASSLHGRPFSHARVLRSLGLAIVLAALLLPLTASRANAEQLRGAQAHVLWSGVTPEQYDRELDLLQQAGATAVRIDLSWSSLETEGKGLYSPWYVQKADTVFQHAADRGMKVIATLWSTPCWGSSAPDTLKQGCAGAWWDRGVDRYAPTNPNDYADAAAYVARRWSSQLAALEVWNEPNQVDNYFLRAPDQARAYTDMLKAAYPRVKAEAPGLPVLAGSLSFSDGPFLERLYNAGIKGSFDGISIHPYNEWRDPDDPWKPEWRAYTFLTGVPWIHDIMSSHGDGDKGLWLTEFGFSTCGTGSSWCVSQSQQATYIADSFRIAQRWDYVKAAIVYNLRNKGSDPTDREDQFGLVNRDYTPKPALAAFGEALRAAAAADAAGPSPGSEPAPEPVADPTPQAPQVDAPSVTVSTTGIVPVPVSCTSTTGSCAGTITLRTRPVKTRKRKSRRRIRLASRHVRIKAGQKTVVHFRIPRRKRRLLARYRHIRVTARITRTRAPRSARHTKHITLRCARLRARYGA